MVKPSLDAIWGRCSLVISPGGSDSEAYHSAEKYFQVAVVEQPIRLKTQSPNGNRISKNITAVYKVNRQVANKTRQDQLT